MTRLARSVLALTLALSACTDGAEDDGDDTDPGANRPPPTPTAVRIVPETPLEGTALKVVWDDVVDPDGDPVSYEIRWSVEGEARSFRPQRAEIPGDVVERGQTWTVKVFATDGRDESDRAEASVTIENAPPTITLLDWAPEAPRRDDAVFVWAEATDPEGDPVQLSVVWKVDGAEVASGALDRNGSAVLEPGDYAKGDAIVARVTATDGTDATSLETDVLVVANTPPEQPRLRFGPAYAEREEQLSCGIAEEAVDADGDAITYEVEWTKDRVVLGAAAPLVPGTPAVRTATGARNGELWACLVRASDGTDRSTPAWGGVVIGDAPPDVADLALGQNYGCAARADGRVACWGHDVELAAASGARTRRTRPPLDVSFARLAAGSTFACGVAKDLTLHCWGTGIGGPLVGNVPDGLFVDVAIAGSHACALDFDGEVACWGRGAENEPAGPFSSISVATGHACAADAAGLLTCWLPDGTAVGGTPAGKVRAHTSGGGHTCALLDQDLSVTCWGDDSSGQADAPAGSFLSVAAGAAHTCGVTNDGAVTCWGANDLGQASPPTGTFVGEVWAGETHTCAREASGEIACWGDDRGGALVVPWGAYRDVSAGAGYACFTDRKGLVRCLGADLAGETQAPWGQFVQVDAAVTHTCARTATDDVVCWGDDAFGQSTGLPTGKYADVSAGLDFTCAVEKQTQALKCVGSAGTPIAIPGLGGSVLTVPTGRFTRVTGGSTSACALAADGTAKCWGQLPPSPAATKIWTTIDADVQMNHACALEADGTPRCFGLVVPRPPADALFADITTGGGVACGTRSDGTVDCWGSLGAPALDPPQDVTYDHVSAGSDTVCAVDDGGRGWCWGAWTRQPLDFGL